MSKSGQLASNPYPKNHCSSGPILILLFQVVFTTQARLKMETFGGQSYVCEKGNASQMQRCKYVVGTHIDNKTHLFPMLSLSKPELDPDSCSSCQSAHYFNILPSFVKLNIFRNVFSLPFLIFPTRRTLNLFAAQAIVNHKK